MDIRLRRNRTSAALRDMLAEHSVGREDLIYPIFVSEAGRARVEISSMPGVYQIPERDLADEVKQCRDEGIMAIILFGVSSHKDETGSDSWNPDGLMARMIMIAKKAVPEMLVISDTCFCEYTTHGHCGVVHEGSVDNDQTIINLGKQAVVAAMAGADIIAPSSMMDGQVRAIRRALDENGQSGKPIMSYSSKFCSAFFGPFRDAAGCSLKGDRKTYQMDFRNSREAIRESLQDVAEGADILLIKPGMPNLDIIARVKEATLLPVAAYQVSGEYSMIKFAARAGALDEQKVIVESLTAFKRAGADLILTYFARDAVKLL